MTENPVSFFEHVFIGMLLSSGLFSENDVDTTNKKIYVGLYGISLCFTKTSEDLALYILKKHYGYICFELN